MPTYRQNVRQAGKGPLPKRTLDWLAKGAPVHQRNHEVFYAAQQFRDAGYSFDEAFPRILDRGLADGLSEAEVLKATESGFKGPRRDPIPGPGTMSPPGAQTRPQAGSGPAATPFKMTGNLPDPIPDGFEKFLQVVFKVGEYVSLSEAVPDGKGGFVPGPGQTLKRERWLELFRMGKLAKTFPDNTGVFIRINPMKPGGKTDADVTSFRHCLVEFDLDENGNRVPLEEQWKAIEGSRLPVSAVTFSGDKSLHALVRLDAATKAEFDTRREAVWKLFPVEQFDDQNKNPSRYSRAPGFLRTLVDENGKAYGQGEQQLLAIGIGAVDWQAWERANNSHFPQITSGQELRTIIIPLPPDVISGVIAIGEKGQLCGGSKSFKTWSLVDQGLSVANGVPWWGITTVQSHVLYLNLEIPRPFFEARVRDIARIRGLSIPDNFAVWHLKGCNLAEPDRWNEFLDRLGDYCSTLPHPFLVTDPVYRLLAGRNENAAGDVGALLWQLEEMIQRSGGTNFFGHHFAKGDSTSKAAIDRGAGSGVFSRDPDSIMVMTGNGSAQYSIETILRNHQPVNPFVIEWKPPVFLRNDAIDPAGITPKRGTRGPAPKFSVDQLVKWLGNDVLSTQQFKLRMMQETGMGRSVFYDLLKQAQDQKLIYYDQTARDWQVPMKPLL